MTAKWDKQTKRQGKTPHIVAGQGNPIGGKESQADKQSEIH